MVTRFVGGGSTPCRRWEVSARNGPIVSGPFTPAPGKNQNRSTSSGNAQSDRTPYRPGAEGLTLESKIGGLVRTEKRACVWGSAFHYERVVRDSRKCLRAPLGR